MTPEQERAEKALELIVERLGYVMTIRRGDRWLQNRRRYVIEFQCHVRTGQGVLVYDAARLKRESVVSAMTKTLRKQLSARVRADLRTLDRVQRMIGDPG